MAQIMPIQMKIDTSEISTMINPISEALNKCSSSFEEITEGLQRVGKILTEIGISIYTPDGEFRNLGEILEDAYYDCPNLTKEKGNNLLRPETLETTENSNENGVFDFLNENAYDHINNFFNLDNKKTLF